MKHTLILLSLLLLTSPLFGQSKEKPCYVSVTSSEDFNQTLLSNISISVISQYLKNVKPFPSSGLSGKEHCIYEVTATLDGNKTFVTLQGKDLNSFGDATIVGTDGFQQSLLRSIYRSQRDKRELICSDYPKILEECGDVVRKSAKTVVTEIPAPKKVKPRVSVNKEKVVVSNAKSSKKQYRNEKGVMMCFFPDLGMPDLKTGKPLGEYRDCGWRERGNRTAEAIERGIKECGGYMNWVWTDEHHSKYRCNSKPVVKTKPTKPKSWKGTLFKCVVGCSLVSWWDSDGNDYDEDGNLVTK